jgi:hypothetical protein
MTIFIECHLGCARRNWETTREKFSGELVWVPVKKTEERQKNEFVARRRRDAGMDAAGHAPLLGDSAFLPTRKHGA